MIIYAVSLKPRSNREIDSHFLYKIMLLKNKSEKWEQILFTGITKGNIIILGGAL